MSIYTNVTDAELRARIHAEPSDAFATTEAARRFCDTTELYKLHETVEKAESLTALLESRIADITTCIGDIRDYLQRAVE